VRLSARFRGAMDYHLGALGDARAAARAAGTPLIDLGMGEPREVVPAYIREQAVQGLLPYLPYPRPGGTVELRTAIAGWTERRFAVGLDPERQIIPTSGSKEAIFSLALLAVDPPAGKDVVVATTPGYPIPAAGAIYAGAELLELPLLEGNRFLPDLDAIPAELWSRIAVFWVNYPNNPTGAGADEAFLARLADLAREYDFILASDEAYWELWLHAPTASALALEDLRNVLVFGSLSKRGSMPGYRSGFVAGDPALIDALRSLRSQTGTVPQAFVQAAAAAAWTDDEQPARLRAVLGRRRAVLVGALTATGFRCSGESSVFVWAAVPDGSTSTGVAAWLLERGVLAAAGNLFGAAGDGYVRFASVATDDEIAAAADVIRRFTSE
jgi:aspartate/methionine/tyrosine aminotransferase